MHQLMVAFSENLPYVRPFRKDMLGCLKQNLCQAMTKIFLLQWQPMMPVTSDYKQIHIRSWQSYTSYRLP